MPRSGIMRLVIILMVSLIGMCQGDGAHSDELVENPKCICMNLIYGRRMRCSRMECNNLNTPEELLENFKKISEKKYKINFLHIHNSDFSHIPHNAFYGVDIKKIRFEKSEITNLSDTSTAFEGLQTTLEELTVFGSGSEEIHWDWQQLHRLQNLEVIFIHMVNMTSIDSVFPPLKNLNDLHITHSGITEIVEGAFEELTDLISLKLRHNNIKRITRSMLPNPASRLLYLDLSYNKISTLPADFFQDITTLKQVFLENNRFKILPKFPFKWASQHIEFLSVKGNKLLCNCEMSWLSEVENVTLTGATCPDGDLVHIVKHELPCPVSWDSIPLYD